MTPNHPTCFPLDLAAVMSVSKLREKAEHKTLSLEVQICEHEAGHNNIFVMLETVSL